MMITETFLRRTGWSFALLLFAAFLVGLQVRVTALKSEVQLVEKRIVSLKRQKIYLETEFETRANQQQLKAWNDVDFGYLAPGAGQYLESELQLAALGKPAGVGAPKQIRVAAATAGEESAFPAMVSPLTGRPLGEEVAETKPVDHEQAAADLAKRLNTVEPVKAESKKADDEESRAL